MTKAHIGDVLVFDGEPRYGSSMMGNERVAALVRLRAGTLDGGDGLTYWIWPASGGRRQIENGDDVAWESSGVPLLPSFKSCDRVRCSGGNRRTVVATDRTWRPRLAETARLRALEAQTRAAGWDFETA